MLQIELLLAVHRLLVHPHEHGFYMTADFRQIVALDNHLATGDVDLIFQSNGDTLRTESFFELALVGHDALYV